MLVLLLGLSGLGRAQDASAGSVTLLGSLDPDLNAIGDTLSVPVEVISDAATTPGDRLVSVVDTTDGNAVVGSVLFTVNSDGTVQGEGQTTSSYGQVVGYWDVGAWYYAPDWVYFSNPAQSFSPESANFAFVVGYSTGTTVPATSPAVEVNSAFEYEDWWWYSSAWPGWIGPIYYREEGTTTSHVVTIDLRGDLKQAPGQPSSTCPVCTSCSRPAMAVASLDRFQAGIAISDTPVGYTPPVGVPMNFTVDYHQRLANQPSTFNYSNLGPQWQSSWISYISGGPTNGSSDAVHYTPDGSQYTYGGYQPEVPQGNGLSPVNQGDFAGNQGWTHATLHYRQNPERYELWEPDGSVQTFALGIGTSPNRQFFLTSITDAQGNVTTVNYDPGQAAEGNAVITSVVDPQGNKLVFSYESVDPLQITKVTRSLDGLSAVFGYTGGKLTSIRDRIGITSSFQYASGTNFINRMTTPYGDTTFSSTDGATSLEADMTNPLGQTERVEYQEYLSTSLVAASESGAPSATGLTIDNSNLNTANSFYWSRRAMADAAAGSIATDSEAFYALAEVTHWAESDLGSVEVPLSTKKRLEGRVWYNYPGSGGPDYEIVTNAGVSTSPSVTARLVDSGGSTVTQASFASYNGNGLVTQSVDPLGRTTNYTYDTTNNIDLLEVSQTDGTNQDVLSTMTYNSQHLPLTVTDASGQVTTMTYNAQGQLLTRENALSQTTTLAYNSGRYLSSVTGPVSGATTSYTYDSAGRVHTVTDSEGYVLTYAYDKLDRPICVTYPDSTTDQTVYHNLDVAETIDRQGRATTNRYDAIRELIQTTDPLGRTTKYTWCTCGGLSTLTDPNGNVTTWGLDGEGRVTSKTYADSSAITYTYETNTSRLHSMTDARGNETVYAYNADNTLASTTYTPASGVASTPNVSFTYDTVYNRVTSMSDGTGTNEYSYNAVYSGGSPITGGGRLASVTTPIMGTSSNAVIGYSYDALGRVTNRGVDAETTDLNNVSTTFDALGRVTNVTNALGSFTYAYVDTTSRLASVTYPSGTGLSTTYSYYGNTGDQRLETISNSISGTNVSTFGYTYNPVGTIATWSQQAGSAATCTNTLAYDAADQLISSTNTQSGTNIASNNYHYDPAGNRLAETTLSGTTAGQFNNLNQLTGYSSTTTNETIAGHTSAAVSSVTVNAVSATITSGTNFSASVPLPSGTNVVSVVAVPTSTNTPVTTQRVQIVTSGSSPTALTYDANGNTLTDENGNSYTWDALNRLISITYPSGASSTFAYDGLSRRVQIVEKNSSGTVTSTKNYLWIGNEIVEERDASNNVTKRFFPQGEQQSGTNFYYTRDHLNSVREMCNSSGTIVARYAYDPYGRTTLVSGSNIATKQYAGCYIHQTSGLYLTKHRAYDPNTGRWLSRDPIGEKVGVNLYDYVDNDSENQFDPSGLAPRNSIPPANQTPPLPSGGRSPVTGVNVHGGSEAADGMSLALSLFQSGEYSSLVMLAERKCKQASPSTGIGSICPKCCRIRLREWIIAQEINQDSGPPISNTSFYTALSVTLFLKPCSEIQKADEDADSKVHFSETPPKNTEDSTIYYDFN